MEALLQEQRFRFISPDDRSFILAFDQAMNRLGYDFGGKIGPGYCWGKYMLIYTRTSVKSKNVFARIYIRENSISLRLFLNSVDKHRAFIEQAPAHIKDVFTGSHGDCTHCHNETDGHCRFRKSYTIDGRRIDKCNGITFEFFNPDLGRLSDYLILFTEFFPEKKTRGS